MKFFRDKRFERKLKRAIKEKASLDGEKTAKRNSSTTIDASFIGEYALPLILSAPIIITADITAPSGLVLFTYPFITLIHALLWSFVLNWELNTHPGNAETSYYPISQQQYFDMITAKALKRFWIQQLLLFLAAFTILTAARSRLRSADLAALLLTMLGIIRKFRSFPFFKTAVLAFGVGITILYNDASRAAAFDWAAHALALPTFGANLLLNNALGENGGPWTLILCVSGSLALIARQTLMKAYRCGYNAKLQLVFDGDSDVDDDESWRFGEETALASPEAIALELKRNPVIPADRFSRGFLRLVFNNKELTILRCVHSDEINILSKLRNNLITNSVALLFALLFAYMRWSVLGIISAGIPLLSLAVILASNLRGFEKIATGTTAVPFVAFLPTAFKELTVVSLKTTSISFLAFIPTGTATAITSLNTLFDIPWHTGSRMTFYAFAIFAAAIPAITIIKTIELKTDFKSIWRAVTYHFSILTALAAQAFLGVAAFMGEGDSRRIGCVAAMFAVSTAAFAAHAKWYESVAMDYVHKPPHS